MDNITSYLSALIQVTGRLVFSEEQLKQIVLIRGSKKLLKAYNMADGTSTQAEICKKLKIDASNFSKTISRWITHGIMFKIGNDKEIKLLHVYPILEENSKTGKKEKKENG